MNAAFFFLMRDLRKNEKHGYVGKINQALKTKFYNDF